VMEATGERFIPELMGGQLIEAEHLIRYALGAQLAPGKRVLDAGCGVGWGTLVLRAAGAASASAIDIDPGAVEDARKRVPDADVRQGDLGDLPWPDGSFDLVVCFEALEHVEHQDRVLDELVRVLVPDGILLVSSPNPDVYPAGNPFHVHELRPEELRAAVQRRLANVCLLHQHEQMASVLVPPGAVAPKVPAEAAMYAVGALEDEEGPYSLVVASQGELPGLPVILGCAPSVPEQLLVERMERVRRFQEAIRYPARHRSMEADWEREREALRRERERLGALLLESEQRLAPAPESQDADDNQVDLEVAHLRIVVSQLEREYAKVLHSTSWRLTKPIRLLSRLRARRP
jgi:2-polyprenyl-3-methyl-5-hydroxy-6-metoxy-1,4-benzoquinol methylase